MSKIIKFDTQKVVSGDFSEVKQALRDSVEGKIHSNNLLHAIDAACVNDHFREDFQDSFNREAGTAFKFRLLSEDEQNFMRSKKEFQKKQYDVTQTTVEVTIETTVLPAMEAFIRNTELLGLIQTRQIGNTNYHQMYDYDVEKDGAILSEVAAGTDVDDALRTGDRLIPNQKVQASMKLSEFAIKTLSAAEMGTWMARLANRVRNTLVTAILYNGNGVANGTARGDNMRGIKNNYGVDGTGDATNAIGAISYANTTTTDAVVTGAGLVAPTDAYDRLVKFTAASLPNNIVDAQEDEYIYAMRFSTWGIARTIQDSTGRYKALPQTDPTTGKPQKLLDGKRVVVMPQIAANEVFLFPPKFYTLIINGDIMNLTDDGVVQLKEGLVQYVVRAWVNGSMEYGQKFAAGTAATIGTTAPDNADQNAFRTFFIA